MNDRHARVNWIAVALGVLASVALLLVFFGEVFRGRAYYPGDTARLYLPLRTALREALRSGRLPWWTSQMGIGYPLLAEGEMGALYPPNWVTALLFAPEVGLSVSLILHAVLAFVGMMSLVRAMERSWWASVLGAIVFVFGGFYVGHLSHSSIIHTASWLPWMFLLVRRLMEAGERASARNSVRTAAVLVLVVALQFVAGHAQTSLLGLVALGLYALCLSARLTGERRIWSWQALLLAAGAVGIGALLASPQLLASAQLGELSSRAGGLDDVFFTSYSFHPLMTATYLSPFALGNPYPEGSVELMVYVGLFPLLLSSVALWRCKRLGAKARRDLVFFSVLGVLGWLLSFGRWNPLYALLRHVPILNLFRVPARYLYWTSLSLALLAGLGLDALLSEAGEDRGRRGGWLVAVLALLLALVPMGVWRLFDAEDAVDGLVALWRWLPLLLCVIGAIVVLARRRAMGTDWVVLVIALVVVDLHAYGAVLDRTYNATWPVGEIRVEPSAVTWLRGDMATDDRLGYRPRVYTKEEILPALSVQRASLYPNMGLTRGIASANLYSPLVPTAYGACTEQLDATRLNRLAVGYYIIPQLLPVDEASELYDVKNPYAGLPSGEAFRFEPQAIQRVWVESYLSHSAGMSDGELAARLMLRDDSGSEAVLPIAVGVHSSEWAYDRDDVLEQIAHSRAELARSFPARSGFPPREHLGHTYGYWYTVPADRVWVAIELVPEIPDAFVRVETVLFEDASGVTTHLAHLIGRGDHQLVYRDEDAVIYANRDALPRAYLVTREYAVSASRDMVLSDDLTVETAQPARIIDDSGGRIVVVAEASEESLLVLADLWYPGWVATVDGEPVETFAVDQIFRGLWLRPGEHRIVYQYRSDLRLMFGDAPQRGE